MKTITRYAVYVLVTPIVFAGALFALACGFFMAGFQYAGHFLDWLKP